MGYAARNDGLGWRAVTDATDCLATETYSVTQPVQSSEQIAAIELAQTVSAMLGTGIAITSTSAPSLNGTYAVDSETRADVLAEMVSILALGTFTNGEATLAWPDTSGAEHTFTVAQFKAFAPALGAFVGALKAYGAAMAGATLPVAAATIA